VGLLPGPEKAIVPKLRETTLHLGSRVPDIARADDVVAVKNGACAVAGNFHCDALFHAGKPQIADGAASEVMEQQVGATSVLAGRLPGLTELANALALIEEHPGAVGEAVIADGFCISSQSRICP